ncbi:MAG: HAD family phosphatase [Lachnospiraceae bacterium]|nr:HAD family phosphatase [Lachnospiraceae bacterium]
MTDVRFILWDMDGTLINSEPQHYRAWQMTVKRLFGVEELDFEAYKACIGTTLPVTVRIIGDICGKDLTGENVIPEHAADKRMLEELEGFPPMPGALETVRTLHERGIRMAVASSSPEEYLHRVVRALGIEDCFEACVSAIGCAHSKPAPDVFLKAMEVLGAKPEETVVVEDSGNGVLAGLAAGCRVIGFYNPDSGEQDIAPADVIVRDLRRIPALIN